LKRKRRGKKGGKRKKVPQNIHDPISYLLKNGVKRSTYLLTTWKKKEKKKKKEGREAHPDGSRLL